MLPEQPAVHRVDRDGGDDRHPDQGQFDFHGRVSASVLICSGVLGQGGHVETRRGIVSYVKARRVKAVMLWLGMSRRSSRGMLRSVKAR